jgi:Flp pilus assembly pilin Flp
MLNFPSVIIRLSRDEHGQEMTEYALLVAAALLLVGAVMITTKLLY